MPMIACEHCDALNKEGADVCVECGASLKPAEASSSAAPPPLPGAAAPPPVPGSAARKARTPAEVRGAARVASPTKKYGVKSRAERIAEDGGVRERSRSRRQESAKKGNSSALRILLVTVGALFVVGGGAWAMTRPPAIESALEEFAGKWSAGDVKWIRDQIYASSSLASSRIEGDLKRRGWLPKPPALGDVELDGHEDNPMATWACDGGELKIRWKRVENGTWRIYSYSLPDWKTPSISPAVDAFRSAWDGNGPSGLRALCRDADGRVANGVQRLLEKRDWAEQRPSLGDASVGESRRGKCSVQFSVAGGELKLRFEFWHPRWCLSGFKLP